MDLEAETVLIHGHFTAASLLKVINITTLTNALAALRAARRCRNFTALSSFSS